MLKHGAAAPPNKPLHIPAAGIYSAGGQAAHVAGF